VKKIAVLGSCLSGLVAKELVSSLGYHLKATLHHTRLDAFSSYLKDDNAFGIPFSEVDNIYAKLAQDGASEKSKRFNVQLRNRLRYQTTSYLHEFFEHLKNVDVLIVDNNYDLSRTLVRVKNDSAVCGGAILNIDCGTGTSLCDSLGLMNVANASTVYRDLVDGLRCINKNIVVIYINYPVSGFENARSSKERIARAFAFAKEVAKVDSLISFPLVSIPRSGLTGKGAFYFNDDVYSLYAKTIDKVLGGAELTFNPASEISFAELNMFCYGKKLELLRRQKNPYADLPDRQFWKKGVGDRYPLAIDQLYTKKYEILPDDGIATFGSCFAQHIGRRLQAAGFNYLDVEKAPSTMAPADRVANGYEIYSARYGNVYTSTQLLQLVQRALGMSQFDEVWELPPDRNSTVRFVDPFRPNLTPEGYMNPEVMLIEQACHLRAVRDLLAKLDVFIFTMGLTEHWYNHQTGAVYPISPGVTAGHFDPDIHRFRNLTYEETMRDMLAVIDLIRGVNPNFRMLLTVSPVPLTATAEDRHVLVSTIHSKSILRAVAGELERRFEFIDYFPSYEIVVAPPFRGGFFQNNMRTVHEQGVDFVMSHFFSQHRPPSHQHAEMAGACGVGVNNEDFCDEVFLELEQLKERV